MDSIRSARDSTFGERQVSTLFTSNDSYRVILQVAAFWALGILWLFGNKLSIIRCATRIASLPPDSYCLPATFSSDHEDDACYHDKVHYRLRWILMRAQSCVNRGD